MPPLWIPKLVGLAAAFALVLGAISALARDRHRPTGRWWALLVAGALATAWLPGPWIPVRIERSVYAGPDLLAGAEVHSEPGPVRWRVRGWLGVRVVRTTQDGRLLSERVETGVRLPWLVALVAAAYLLPGLKPRPGGPGPRPSSDLRRPPPTP